VQGRFVARNGSPLAAIFLFLYLLFSTFICIRVLRWFEFLMEDGMADDNNDGMAKGLIVGFIAGSVVGAVMALLYAPKSGKELRRDIKEKTGELVEKGEDYIAKARTKATEIVNEAKKKSDTLISDAKKQAIGLMGDAERILTDARTKQGG
jgi:gas vesicle protein